MDYTIIDMIAAEHLKNARDSHSLTQNEFAEMLGIARPTYACYEKGIRSMPMDVFMKACKLLNLDPYAIMKEASEAYAKTFEK